MTNTLSPPVRRFAALSVLAILLYAVWAILMQPIYDYWSEGVDELAQNQRLLSSYQRVLREKPQWESRNLALQAPQYAAIFIEGSDPNVAGAKLQSAVMKLIEAEGGKIGSIQILPPDKQKERDLQRLALRVSFSMPVESAFKFFEQVETASPILFVDQLTMAAPEKDSGADAVQTRLSINGTFYGYLTPEAL